MKTLANDNKNDILFKLMEIQITEMRNKEHVEQILFQWTSGLLLAVFGVIIALADKTNALPSAVSIKILSTVIVFAPTLLSVLWIFRRSRTSIGNAQAIERIQDLLGLFEDNIYGSDSPYPKEWKGTLAKGRKKRKTPIYYSTVLLIMSTCVILAIWLVL